MQVHNPFPVVPKLWEKKQVFIIHLVTQPDLKTMWGYSTSYEYFTTELSIWLRTALDSHTRLNLMHKYMTNSGSEYRYSYKCSISTIHIWKWCVLFLLLFILYACCLCRQICTKHLPNQINTFSEELFISFENKKNQCILEGL